MSSCTALPLWRSSLPSRPAQVRGPRGTTHHHIQHVHAGFASIILKNELNDEALGFQSMATIYFVFAGANFLSPTIVNYLGAPNIAVTSVCVTYAAAGPKLSMIVGAVTYTLYICAFAYFASAASILATSAILGVGAGVLWTAQVCTCVPRGRH